MTQPPDTQAQSPQPPGPDTQDPAARIAAAHAAARRAAEAHKAAAARAKAQPPPAPAPQPTPARKPAESAASKRLTEARSVLPALTKQLRSLAESERRADLLSSMDATIRRSADSSVRVAVVGPRQKGKSQLINALLGADVCAVGERRSTTVVTVIRAAETPNATLLVGQPSDPRPRPMPLPMEELQSNLAKSTYAEGHDVLGAEIGIKSAILAGNLALVDTPGVGGRGQPHAVRVLNEVAMSDAVIVVTDASQEFTQPDLHFLRKVGELCPTVAIALTKTDLYPDWRRIAEANQRHLQRADFGYRILPLSSALRTHALRLGDKELNAESGYAHLMQFLGNDVLADAANKRIIRIVRDFESVAQHLVVPLEAELRALRDPEFREKMTTELKEKKQLADARAKATSTWQQVLSDGIADLNSEVDHDMKTRMRLIGKELEVKLADSRPDSDWPRTVEWLQEQVGTAVADNFVWAYESARALAERVAISFAEDGDGVDLPALTEVCGGQLIDPELSVGELSEVKSSRVQKVLTGVRSGYSGSTMVGMGTQLLGMATMNPITLAAGIFLGGQSLKDDRNNRLTRRRSEAQSVARKYIDEVSFQVSKLSRDRLRAVQRTLRDHFKSIAEQEQASLQSSVKAAQEAANLEVAEREKRANQADKKLAALKKCREITARLLAAGAASG